MEKLTLVLGALSALLLASAAGAQTAPPDGALSQTQSSENASNAAKATQTPADPPPPSVQPHEDKRAYGVLPNYRTAEADVPFAPITSHQKLIIGVKDSFDGVAYPLAAFFSGGVGSVIQHESFLWSGSRGICKTLWCRFRGPGDGEHAERIPVTDRIA